MKSVFYEGIQIFNNLTKELNKGLYDGRICRDVLMRKSKDRDYWCMKNYEFVCAVIFFYFIIFFLCKKNKKMDVMENL